MIIPFTKRWRLKRAEDECAAKSRLTPTLFHFTTVQFRPFRFTGPTYSNGLSVSPTDVTPLDGSGVLSNWNWTTYQTEDDDD